FLSSEIRRIILRNGGTVRAPRELEDFTQPGWGPNGQVLADPDFPRQWQQNPLYYLGVPGMFGAPVLGNKNNDGINARTTHIRGFAAAPAQIDLVLATHTNADGGVPRGTLVEYLNVEPAGGAPGNPLGA